MNNANTAEIMEKGMACLLENLGEIETERFISVIIRERFDYTKWRKTYFGDMSVTELNSDATAYAQEHPFKPKNVACQTGRRYFNCCHQFNTACVGFPPYSNCYYPAKIIAGTLFSKNNSVAILLQFYCSKQQRQILAL